MFSDLQVYFYINISLTDILNVVTCVCGLRLSDDVRQQQAPQSFVYLPTTQVYDSRPPPGPVGQSGEPTIIGGSSAAGAQQSWETGRMMAVSSAGTTPETFPTTTYAPYQASAVEPRPGVGPAEDWSQYGASYRQSAEVTTPEYHPEYYGRHEGIGVGEDVSEGEPGRPTGGVDVPRNASSSALRQAASSGSGKKTVTFHENIATEYAIRQSYGSTSSDNSFVTMSPSGYEPAMYQSPVTSYSSPVPR